MSKAKQQLLPGLDFGDADSDDTLVKETKAKEKKAKSKRTKAKPKKKNKTLFRFSLDNDDEDEQQMIQDLDYFKSERQYSTKIRQALQLLFALLLGDLSVLQKLFPMVVKRIENEATAKLQIENAKLQKQVTFLQKDIQKSEAYIVELEVEQVRQRSEANAIQARFDRLENLLINNGYRQERPSDAPHSTRTHNPAGGIGLKGMQGNNSGVGLRGTELGSRVVTPPQPIFDDDEDMPALDFIASETNTEANQNLMTSLLGL